MRTILKIIAAPFVLALILIVAVLTFLSCVAERCALWPVWACPYWRSSACWPGRQ